RVVEPGLDADLLLVSKRGQTIRMGLKSVPTRGRNTQGVILMRVKNDSVASISLLKKTPEALAEVVAEAGGEVATTDLKEVKMDITPEEAMLKAEKAADEKEYSKTGLDKMLKAAKEDGKAQSKAGKSAGDKKKDDKKGKAALKKAKKKK
ncbi:MAG: DNA gyrase C-terminal beta-propeller domain-containing protein, partial [Candidatus Gracilibacteria bacterium]|nr:DNA gyrase C-terminal beta-propeller domain-containing protein [Candidatus Gracilibacteria bacterium]